MTDDEIRDADGCEDYESLEESGLHEDAPQNDPESLADDDESTTFDDPDADADVNEEKEEEAPDADSAAVNELNETKDRYMRLFAEFDNFRKRTAKEKAETFQDAVAKTVGELLPMIDSFTLAMGVPCSDEAYRAGIEKIYTQLTAILTKLGVTETPGCGAEFDPKLHNAIQQIDDPEYAEGTVCKVYQKGYLLGERVIRSAIVAVAN